MVVVRVRQVREARLLQVVGQLQEGELVELVEDVGVVARVEDVGEEGEVQAEGAVAAGVDCSRQNMRKYSLAVTCIPTYAHLCNSYWFVV